MLVALAALSLVSCGKKGGNSLADLQDNEFPVCTVGESSADMQTSYPATIKGIQDVEVHPKLSGYITNVYVHEGQAVRAGQVMFTIDSETYRAAVSQSLAALNTAIAQANTTKLTYLKNDVDFLADFSTMNRNIDFAGRFVYDEQGREVVNFGKYKGKSFLYAVRGS